METTDFNNTNTLLYHLYNRKRLQKDLENIQQCWELSKDACAFCKNEDLTRKIEGWLNDVKYILTLLGAQFNKIHPSNIIILYNTINYLILKMRDATKNAEELKTLLDEYNNLIEASSWLICYTCKGL
jgi:hypothetical protein